MLQKLEDYQAEAQKKEVYYWTTILDPRIKLNVFKSEVFTKKKVEILYSRRNFLILFPAQFSEHKKGLQGSSRKVQSTRRVCAWLCSSATGNWFDSIFKSKKVSDLDAEIKTYFQKPLEDQLVNPLQFWLMKKDLFPTLSLMARKFLAVPSTTLKTCLFALLMFLLDIQLVVFMALVEKKIK